MALLDEHLKAATATQKMARTNNVKDNSNV